jgi:hypothetical protein
VDPLAPAPSLDILGRCSRAVGCDDDQARGGGLPAQLHMLNGELINRKLVDQSGRLHRLISAGKTDSEIITEHYLRALGRRPTTRELQRWCDLLASPDSTDRTSRLEDFTWGLLNSRQFAENH